MYIACVEPPWGLDAWRMLARAALRAEIPPDRIAWTDDMQATLIPGTEVTASTPLRDTARVPLAFFDLAATVLCHRDPQRHALLYRILWRLATGERNLLQRLTEPDILRAHRWAKAVHRDTRHIKGLVRFREIAGIDSTFIAWFEPEHFTLDRAAPHFARRFADMHWAILTPYRSVRWDGRMLTFAPGGTCTDIPGTDAQEALWRTFYASVFNPARLNPALMRQQMPQKYWKLLPEARELPDLIHNAGKRADAMIESPVTQQKTSD
ncbi:MAG: TIGR03915 family putative DNA repair protein [Xanthomonadaceae bacterium]|nr:TIGR03915 family putative DNA repair protein [Xanthomonadaceae bacterium]